MSYGSHESSQYVGVVWRDDHREVEFHLTLICATLGCKAQLYGEPGDCYPAEAAEFELDSIHVLDDEGNPVLITYQILEAIVGMELAAKFLSNAETEAMESGEF